MLLGAFAQYFFGISIFISSIFLILLVLVQRGRGGGLTGALGGPGGQSAFGTKAGDLFTRITIGVATAWIFLCAASVFFLRPKAAPDMAGEQAVQSAGSMGGDQAGDSTAASEGLEGATSSTAESGTSQQPAEVAGDEATAEEGVTGPEAADTVTAETTDQDDAGPAEQPIDSNDADTSGTTNEEDK